MLPRPCIPTKYARRAFSSSQAAPESALLAGLVGGGRWGGMEGALQEMEEAADWKVGVEGGDAGCL